MHRIKLPLGNVRYFMPSGIEQDPFPHCLANMGCLPLSIFIFGQFDRLKLM